jgi:hypothetical protein
MIWLGPSGFGAAGKEAQMFEVDQHQAFHFLGRLLLYFSSAGYR